MSEREKVWYDEAAKELKVCRRTLDNWRARGVGPEFHRPPGLVYCYRDELEQFIQERKEQWELQK
jgi:hypothetical protein